MFLKSREIPKWIELGQFTGVDEARGQIPGRCTVLVKKKGKLAVKSKLRLEIVD